jgi:pimeloyl-ACP methyl ester carboxylesterase
VIEHPFVAHTDAGDISGVQDGEGFPLLLLHGGPGLTDYMAQLDAETRGYRRIRYQQRGTAPSTLDGPFTVARHIADVVAVLDELGVERAIVAGHSWGGHLAPQLAIAWPNRVAALLLIDPPGSEGDGGLMAAAKELEARILPSNRARADEVTQYLATQAATEDLVTETLALRWPGYYADPATAPPFPLSMRLSIRANQETLASLFDELGNGAFATALTTLTMPTAFVLGEKSPVPHRCGEATAATIPDAEVALIAGAGHLPWHEHPGCVADALGRLCSRIT